MQTRPYMHVVPFLDIRGMFLSDPTVTTSSLFIVTWTDHECMNILSWLDNRQLTSTTLSHHIFIIVIFVIVKSSYQRHYIICSPHLIKHINMSSHYHIITPPSLDIHCWNKMSLTMPLKFWWHQCMKSSIGYANTCSSVQDHKLKFICLKAKYWFWKNKWEQRNFQRKLSFKSESEEVRVQRSSRSWLSEPEVHSESEGSSKAEVKNLKLVYMGIWRHKYAEWLEDWCNGYSEDLESIRCLYIGKEQRRTIVQLYNHYLHYSNISCA